MVSAFIKIKKARQKSGFLNSYKVETSFLEEAAAARHHHDAPRSLLRHFFSYLGYS